MPSGVLVDTSFLITLAGDRRANHDAAVKYWKHFKDSGMVIYLSVIVVSEFSVKQSIPDDIRLSCVPVIFNWDDAIRAAKFDQFREKVAGVERSALKDDMKIIAQAAGKDVAYVITDDGNSFAKYCRVLHEHGKIKFKIIELSDGFDMSHFREPTLFDEAGS